MVKPIFNSSVGLLPRYTRIIGGSYLRGVIVARRHFFSLKPEGIKIHISDTVLGRRASTQPMTPLSIPVKIRG
jgi:hypothetical protein